jgi:hypothetical protein
MLRRLFNLLHGVLSYALIIGLLGNVKEIIKAELLSCRLMQENLLMSNGISRIAGLAKVYESIKKETT